MKVAITSTGKEMTSPIHGTLDGCEVLVFIDTENPDEMDFVENPAKSDPDFREEESARFLILKKAEALITGSIGPKGWEVLDKNNIPVFEMNEGVVEEALEAFISGRSPLAQGPDGGFHREDDGTPRPPETAPSIEETTEQVIPGGEGRGFGKTTPEEETFPKPTEDDPNPHREVAEPLERQDPPDANR